MCDKYHHRDAEAGMGMMDNIRLQSPAAPAVLLQNHNLDISTTGRTTKNRRKKKSSEASGCVWLISIIIIGSGERSVLWMPAASQDLCASQGHERLGNSVIAVRDYIIL